MSSGSRIAVAARSHGQDLLRRRVALILLLLIPAAMYLSVMGQEADLPVGAEPWTLQVGVIGVGWSVAGGAFFLGLSSRRIDERLVLGGYRRAELAVGRLLFLAVFAAVVAAIYSAFIGTASRAEAPTLILAISLTSLLALVLGLAVAALVGRELEGFLVLIAIIGVQTTIHGDLPIAPLLPFHGPIQLLGVAWSGAGPVLGPLLHAAAATAALAAVFFVLWGRGLRA